ncbi:hypothetical protein GQ53DRAFT_28203 [Thozetella sp. PMI_491]|nr:hypothetical protein GQ53DRAFT_28203 [Thozetella sp. PMI_491]
MRVSKLQSALGHLIRPRITNVGLRSQSRWVHEETRAAVAPPHRIPSPIPLVPDVETFLTVIGRGLRQHAAKFPTWDALFTLSSDQLRELGVEPPRTRRYLLQWRQKFREGKYGIGGDLKHVENGKAELRVEEIPKNKTGSFRLRHVVNTPPDTKVEDIPKEERVKVDGFTVRGARIIKGPYALPMKQGEGATISVTEGMWEHRRGHKVDGGERRQAEVRFKRRVAERRARREQGP